MHMYMCLHCEMTVVCSFVVPSKPPQNVSLETDSSNVSSHIFLFLCGVAVLNSE